MSKDVEPLTKEDLEGANGLQVLRAWNGDVSVAQVRATVEALDTALARVKELESELKEAHRQRLEACEGESERAVERDEALKELEEVKARADAAEARAERLRQVLAGLADRHFPLCAARYSSDMDCDCEMRSVRAALSTPKVKP